MAIYIKSILKRKEKKMRKTYYYLLIMQLPFFLTSCEFGAAWNAGL